MFRFNNLWILLNYLFSRFFAFCWNLIKLIWIHHQEKESELKSLEKDNLILKKLIAKQYNLYQR